MSKGGFTRGSTAIVGAATFGIGKCPGVSAVDMAARAALLALADAGIGLQDVDALYTSAPYEALGGMELAEYLGIAPKVTDCNRTGGSAFEVYVQQAAIALEAGLIDCALIAYGSNPASNPPPIFFTAGDFPMICRVARLNVNRAKLVAGTSFVRSLHEPSAN